MNHILTYLLCILYTILMIVHSFTLCHKDYYRGLISIFSVALITETVWTILVTIHLLVEHSGQDHDNLTFNLDSAETFQYNAQFIHIIAMNLFILFLLIVAKGWPITRRNMPFKYAFAMFWLLCVLADLITFYWTVISNGLTPNINDNSMMRNNSLPHQTDQSNHSTTINPNQKPINESNGSGAHLQQENFNSSSHKLSLLLRVIIMIYFLLELRTTMILEQEKKKLQFYLHFGALTMVWLVHTLIVYVISLRVDDNWRSELVSGCSAVANFIGFLVTTKLLWPKSSRSYLFKNSGDQPIGASGDLNAEGCEIDNYSIVIREDDVDMDEEYCGDTVTEQDGLKMRDLSKPGQTQQSRSTSDSHLTPKSNS